MIQSGAPAVREFATKLRQRGQEFGIIVSAHGITGDAESLTAAQNAIAGALQDRVSIVVISRAELEGLHDGTDLVELVKRKLCALAVMRAAL